MSGSKYLSRGEKQKKINIEFMFSIQVQKKKLSQLWKKINVTFIKFFLQSRQTVRTF